MKINICLASVMTVICTGTAALAGALTDDLADGKSLYKQGQYNKAAEAFKRVIEKNGRNSTAHYYMANCYVAKHDWNEAKAEYRSAASLTNDEKVRNYCLSVVASLETSHPSASSSGGVSGSGSGGPSDFDRAQSRLNSVLGQGQSEAKFVLEQADRECARVNQEKNAALMPLQGVNIRSQTVYHSEEEKQAVAAPYDRQLAEIRSRAQARANSLMQDAQKKGNDVKLQ